MTSLLWLALAFAVGTAAGVVHFVGLWTTMRGLATARHPALVLLASGVLRFGLAAGAFVVLARAGGWPWVAAALAGFILARTVIVRRVRTGVMPPEGRLP